MSDVMNDNLSKIDAVIAAAKARKIALDSQDSSEDKKSRPRLTIENRAEKKAEILRGREARQEAKKMQVAHMTKLNKASEKLPPMNDTTLQIFSDIVSNLSADQITAMSRHLQHHNRLKSTEKSLASKINAGDAVRIVGGDPRFLGMHGTIVESRRIRCFVNVPGCKKPVYCFTSDVEPA